MAETEIKNNINDTKQYVTFLIGKEKFGIEVMRIREVMYLVDITEIPNTMPYMKGVIDLRGTVIPLVDARVKFKMQEKKYDDDTVIIIGEFENQLIGLIVDSISDVKTIPMNEIQNPAHFSDTEIEKDYLYGIARDEEEMIILLEMDRIFSQQELENMATQLNVPEQEVYETDSAAETL